jgi:hypothetical protein
MRSFWRRLTAFFRGDGAVKSANEKQIFSRELKASILGFYRLDQGVPTVYVPERRDRDQVSTTLLHEQMHRNTIQHTVYGYILTALARLSTAEQLSDDERKHWSSCYDKLASGAFYCLEGVAVASEVIVARMQGMKDSAIIGSRPRSYRKAFARFRPLLKIVTSDKDVAIEAAMASHSLVEAISEYAMDRGIFAYPGLPSDFAEIVAWVSKLPSPDKALRSAVDFPVLIDWRAFDQLRRQRIAEIMGDTVIDDLPDDISTLEPATRIARDSALIMKQQMWVIDYRTHTLKDPAFDIVIPYVAAVRDALQRRWPALEWPSYDPNVVVDLLGLSSMVFRKAETQFEGRGHSLEDFTTALIREAESSERHGAVLRFYQKTNRRYDILANPILSVGRRLQICDYWHYVEDVTVDDIVRLDEAFRGSKHVWQTFFAATGDRLLEADLISRLALPVFLYKRVLSDTILREIIDRRWIGEVKDVRVFSLPKDPELQFESIEAVKLATAQNVHAYGLIKRGLLGAGSTFFGLPVITGKLTDDVELAKTVIVTVSFERGKDADQLPAF